MHRTKAIKHVKNVLKLGRRKNSEEKKLLCSSRESSLESNSEWSDYEDFGELKTLAKVNNVTENVPRYVHSIDKV